MVQDLIEKRSIILGNIKQMHDELNKVNSEIDTEIADNSKRIAELQKEVASLNTLKTQNIASVKRLKNILGE